MKGEYSNNPRTIRLNEVYRESGRKSCNAFAASIVGTNQRSTQNYVDGTRIPTDDFLNKVVKSYPQFNSEWLLEGRGEKYNPKYVEVRNSPSPQIVGNSNNGANTIGSESSMEELKDLYNQLVSSLREQIEILKRENELLHRLLDDKE